MRTQRIIKQSVVVRLSIAQSDYALEKEEYSTLLVSFRLSREAVKLHHRRVAHPLRRDKAYRATIAKALDK
jgi:hypothetical protein